MHKTGRLLCLTNNTTQRVYQWVVVWMVLCTRVLCTVYVNWNDDGWNVNSNSVDNPNEWNDGNQVFSRNYYFFSYIFVGVFASKPFFQPPIIFPSSCKCSERVIYLSVSSSFVSQLIDKKNFRESKRRIVFLRVIIFSSGF